MDKKLSNIKERVLYLTEYKGIAKEKFFTEIGMTYGSFKGKQKETSLNSDAIDKILSILPEIEPAWLLNGSGNMLKNDFETGNIEIGNRIKDLREKLGFNQRSFATEIGLDPSQYNKIENGKLMPTLTQVMDLCHGYGLSADWLLFGTAGQASALQKQLELAEDHIKVLKENKEYMHAELERLKSRKEKIREYNPDAAMQELSGQNT